MRLSPLTSILLFLWIFFIPTSIALHYNKEAGLVHGVLVDYRMPSITASALLLIALFCSYCFETKFSKNKRISIKDTIVAALFVAVLFQSSLGLYQVITQHSLFSYVPFGEVDISSPLVVHSTFLNGTLLALAYGTTIHPNVLAGFVVVSMLLCLLLTKNKPILFMMFCLTLLTSLLTQSASSTTALFVGFILYFVTKVATTKVIIPLRVSIMLLPIGSIVILSIFNFQKSGITSLSRRSQLDQIAIHMILKHPIRGVGWNNYTLKMEDYGYVSSTTRFLQPVHNVFLLLIAEIGIVGVGAFVIWASILWKIPKGYLPLLSCLSVLGSLDHYLISLTTGRMLLLLVIAVLYTHQKLQEENIKKRDIIDISLP